MCVFVLFVSAHYSILGACTIRPGNYRKDLPLVAVGECGLEPVVWSYREAVIRMPSLKPSMDMIIDNKEVIRYMRDTQGVT